MNDKDLIKMVPDVESMFSGNIDSIHPTNEAIRIFVKSAKLLIHKQTDYFKWSQIKANKK